MSVIEPGFLTTLQADPQQSVDVIITMNVNPEVNIAQVEGSGLTVTRKFGLIKAIAASGPASAVIGLANEDWITKIEPDGPVQAY